MADTSLVATAIPIHQIHPDPNQPRRWLPSDISEALTAGATPVDILSQLRERKRDKWVQERLVELDALADSIAADGLMQPIRVILDSEGAYRIEAGERRWWAHQILLGRGDAHFETIAAFIVDSGAAAPGMLRRRVAENVHRSGFTAIELARAMGARIEEIALAEPTLARREIEKRVGKENGLSDRRVRQHLALLKLPGEVQELAQQARMSEGSLRGLVSIKDPTRQMAAAQKLVHPTKTNPASRKDRAGNRKPRGKATRHTLPNPRPSATVPWPLVLIRLARRLEQRNNKEIGRELGKTVKNEKECEALAHLGEALKDVQPSDKIQSGAEDPTGNDLIGSKKKNRG
ncbi:MAG: ParB/RepB/Spo0J family partition protein [Chloroflexi bacterium]|nr:ParB/RepB/Spo0J family partition protein [Chloroflexota bacterium]